MVTPEKGSREQTGLFTQGLVPASSNLNGLIRYRDTSHPQAGSKQIGGAKVIPVLIPEHE